MSSFNIKPSTPPTTNATRLYTIGKRIFFAVICPERDAVATAMATENATSPTTSSSATTCKSVSTKSPCAPVCRMVIIVEAGAVAAASDASTIENARLIFNAKYMTKNTRIEASNASKTVMTMFLPPFFLRVESLKNSPVLNAINASAISARKLIPCTTPVGMILRQYGPMIMPATI